MALLKYKDVLVLCKEKIKEAMGPLRAREMKKKAELEVCKIESQIAEGEQKIQELASEYPIDFYKMIDAIDDVDLVKRRKEQLEQIIEEMLVKRRKEQFEQIIEEMFGEENECNI